MCTTFRSLLAVLAATVGMLAMGSIQADQIRMKNGDVITGSVTKIEDDKLFIEPDYADEFSVDLAEVVSIEAEEVFEIEMV